jgi:hypothetical protein
LHAICIEYFVFDANMEGWETRLNQCHLRKSATAINQNLGKQFDSVGQPQALSG